MTSDELVAIASKEPGFLLLYDGIAGGYGRLVGVPPAGVHDGLLRRFRKRDLLLDFELLSLALGLEGGPISTLASVGEVFGTLRPGMNPDADEVFRVQFAAYKRAIALLGQNGTGEVLLSYGTYRIDERHRR